MTRLPLNPCTTRCTPTPRLLIVPGLHDSGPAHWQSWLQGQYRRASRVAQRDWSDPQLDEWSERIEHVLDCDEHGPWLAVAHSFGALALAAHLASRPDSPIRAALLVAPADPAKFGLLERLPRSRLRKPVTVVGSETDPWMMLHDAKHWARLWGAQFVNLGDAGHINTAAGFGPLPMARRWVTTAGQRLAAKRHATSLTSAPPSTVAASFTALAPQLDRT